MKKKFKIVREAIKNMAIDLTAKERTNPVYQTIQKNPALAMPYNMGKYAAARFAIIGIGALTGAVVGAEVFGPDQAFAATGDEMTTSDVDLTDAAATDDVSVQESVAEETNADTSSVSDSVENESVSETSELLTADTQENVQAEETTIDDTKQEEVVTEEVSQADSKETTEEVQESSTLKTQSVATDDDIEVDGNKIDADSIVSVEEVSDAEVVDVDQMIAESKVMTVSTDATTGDFVIPRTENENLTTAIVLETGDQTYVVELPNYELDYDKLKALITAKYEAGEIPMNPFDDTTWVNGQTPSVDMFERLATIDPETGIRTYTDPETGDIITITVDENGNYNVHTEGNVINRSGEGTYEYEERKDPDKTEVYKPVEPTTPEPTTPEPTTPEPTTPEPTTPEPTTPEPTIPEPTIPEPTTPEPTIPTDKEIPPRTGDTTDFNTIAGLGAAAGVAGATLLTQLKKDKAVLETVGSEYEAVNDAWNSVKGPAKK